MGREEEGGRLQAPLHTERLEPVGFPMAFAGGD